MANATGDTDCDQRTIPLEKSRQAIFRKTVAERIAEGMFNSEHRVDGGTSLRCANCISSVHDANSEKPDRQCNRRQQREDEEIVGSRVHREDAGLIRPLPRLLGRQQRPRVHRAAALASVVAARCEVFRRADFEGEKKMRRRNLAVRSCRAA
jgi:hypothetical protein